MTSTKVVLLVNNYRDAITWTIAVKFAQQCYRVALFLSNESRDIRRIANLANEVPEIYSKPENHLIDAINFEDDFQVSEIIPRVVEKFGRLDAIVSNLNYSSDSLSLFDDSLLMKFNQALQVNLFVSTRLAQLGAAHLLKALEGGVIINIAIAGQGKSSDCVANPVIKAGINMLTQTLANSLEGKNVRCITVSSSLAGMGADYEMECPASVKISSNDSSDRFAGLLVFLASDKASYIHGTNIEVADGF